MSRPSLVSGPDHPPLRTETIGQALSHAAHAWPDQEALVSAHQGIRLNYAQLNERASRIAAGLMALGLRRGDLVGLWAPNCAEWPLVQFAVARAGMVLVSINVAYGASELEFMLREIPCKALIVANHARFGDPTRAIESLLPETPSSPAGQLWSRNLPALRHLIRIGATERPGWLPFHELGTRAGPDDLAALDAAACRIDCHDPVVIQFTSGATGLPKGVTLSHHNILNNGYFVGERVGLRSGDRLCIPVPLWHCFGMVMGNLGCLTHGAAMIYPGDAFDPLAVLECIARERCTGLYGVPSMFAALLAHPGFAGFDLSSLRTGCMAGAHCPADILAQVMDVMHMRDVTIAYGMTETSPVSFQTSAGDPPGNRISTIGRPLPHLECKVVDADGDIVPSGMPGELCIRGYSVMLGYWGNEQKTAGILDADGWLRTGDRVALDGQGYGRVIGRSMEETCLEITDEISRMSAQVHILQAVARREPLGTVLDLMCRFVETRLPGSHCAVLVLKAGKSQVAEIIAPWLPESLRAGLASRDVAGLPGPWHAAIRQRQEILDRCPPDPAGDTSCHSLQAPGMRTCWAQPLINADDHVTGLVILMRPGDDPLHSREQMMGRMAADLAIIAIDQTRAQQQLRDQALHDDLTGLPNRRYMREWLAGHVFTDTPDAHPGIRRAALLIDLDDFKPINDSLGHKAGDYVLRVIARRIVDALRPHDIVARLGGDEFSVVLDGIDGRDFVQACARRLVERIAAPIDIRGEAMPEVHVRCSIGIVLHPGDSTSAIQFFARADEAMYAAKAAGKSCYRFWRDIPGNE